MLVLVLVMVMMMYVMVVIVVRETGDGFNGGLGDEEEQGW